MPQDAVIVSGARTAVGRAKKGSLVTCRPEDMARAAIDAAWQRAGNPDRAMVEDVILGCAFPEGSQGLNVARAVALYSGFPHTVPGMTVNRFCSSGVQAIALACERILTGGADVIVAGGVESMSLVPMTGFRISPHPGLVVDMPESYVSMGQTAENGRNTASAADMTTRHHHTARPASTRYWTILRRRPRRRSPRPQWMARGPSHSMSTNSCAATRRSRRWPA
jgi:acetyl-CoA acetyltransferase